MSKEAFDSESKVLLTKTMEVTNTSSMDIKLEVGSNYPEKYIIIPRGATVDVPAGRLYRKSFWSKNKKLIEGRYHYQIVISDKKEADNSISVGKGIFLLEPYIFAITWLLDEELQAELVK